MKKINTEILTSFNTNMCWSCTVVQPGKERLIKKGWMVYLQNHFASNNNTDTLIVHIILSINDTLYLVYYRINKLTNNKY